jgi:kynureninase
MNPITKSIAEELDRNDPLKNFRSLFHIPVINGKPCIYLTGNSLGLQPIKAKEYAAQEFEDWKNLAVEAHFHGKNPWFYYHHFCEETLAEIVGAHQSEVVAMGSLTNNLHLLMVSFYRPTQKRFKILMEANAFPSDQYAIESQVRFHGYNPDEAIIELVPRVGEYTIRNEDVLEVIEKNKEELALVMIGAVNYLSGQYFDLKSITEKAHEHKIICGFDLAHAMGNVPLQLHDWKVDFACWCSYKYLNSGPGGVAGIFVHDIHGNDSSLNRFAGWWGNSEATRFDMKKGFIPQQGAAGWQLSNAPVFPMAIHRASLELFKEAGMKALREKSKKLTEVMTQIINEYNQTHPTERLLQITPQNFDERGCQFSLIAEKDGKKLFEKLSAQGVIADWREPNVIRMSPVPLYNSFDDLFRFKNILMEL